MRRRVVRRRGDSGAPGGDSAPGHSTRAPADGSAPRGERKSNSVIVVILSLAGCGGGLVILAVLAALLIPMSMKMQTQTRRGQSSRQCQRNLERLFDYALVYGEEEGAFPHNEAGSLAAFQELLDFAGPEELDPRLLICSAGPEKRARPGPDGRVRLRGDHECSYEFFPRKVTPTTMVPTLIYDRSPSHGGHRNVVGSDGTVRSVSELEFQELLDESHEKAAGF